MTEDIHLFPTQLHGMELDEAIGKTLTEKCMCFVLYSAAILQICASSQVFYTSIMDSNI